MSSLDSARGITFSVVARKLCIPLESDTSWDIQFHFPSEQVFTTHRPRLCWVDHTWYADNSWVMYITITQLAKWTALKQSTTCYHPHHSVQYKPRKGCLTVTWYHDRHKHHVYFWIEAVPWIWLATCTVQGQRSSDGLEQQPHSLNSSSHVTQWSCIACFQVCSCEYSSFPCSHTVLKATVILVIVTSWYRQAAHPWQHELGIISMI